jgi:methionyl-tRNA formyltransferase
MGTPDFAVPSLKKLLEDGHQIVGVVTRPDKPRGRGKHFISSPIKQEALANNLPVLTPERLKDPDFLGSLRQIAPKLVVVVAFRILPPELLAIPPRGVINLHASLLPKYRGAAPINWAIINGERQTGLTTFCIDEQVDTGDIILQRVVPIDQQETAGELHDRLMFLGAELLSKTVSLVESGNLPRGPQPKEGASEAPKLRKEDARIDWSKPAEQIRDLIRGTNPRPGAFTYRKGTLLKIHRASAIAAAPKGAPGEVLKADRKEGIWIATGEGELFLAQVQPQDRRPMSSAEFVRGYGVLEGEIWG